MTYLTRGIAICDAIKNLQESYSVKMANVYKPLPIFAKIPFHGCLKGNKYVSTRYSEYNLILQ